MPTDPHDGLAPDLRKRVLRPLAALAPGPHCPLHLIPSPEPPPSPPQPPPQHNAHPALLLVHLHPARVRRVAVHSAVLRRVGTGAERVPEREFYHECSERVEFGTLGAGQGECGVCEYWVVCGRVGGWESGECVGGAEFGGGWRGEGEGECGF